MKQSLHPLKAAADLAGLSLSQLSDLCRAEGVRINRPRLHRLLHGARCRPNEAAALAAILKVNPNQGNAHEHIAH